MAWCFPTAYAHVRTVLNPAATAASSMSTTWRRPRREKSASKLPTGTRAACSMSVYVFHPTGAYGSHPSANRAPSTRTNGDAVAFDRDLETEAARATGRRLAGATRGGDSRGPVSPSTKGGVVVDGEGAGSAEAADARVRSSHASIAASSASSSPAWYPSMRSEGSAAGRTSASGAEDDASSGSASTRRTRRRARRTHTRSAGARTRAEATARRASGRATRRAAGLWDGGMVVAVAKRAVVEWRLAKVARRDEGAVRSEKGVRGFFERRLRDGFLQIFLRPPPARVCRVPFVTLRARRSLHRSRIIAPLTRRPPTRNQTRCRPRPPAPPSRRRF